MKRDFSYLNEIRKGRLSTGLVSRIRYILYSPATFKVYMCRDVSGIAWFVTIYLIFCLLDQIPAELIKNVYEPIADYQKK